MREKTKRRKEKKKTKKKKLKKKQKRKKKKTLVLLTLPPMQTSVLQVRPCGLGGFGVIVSLSSILNNCEEFFLFFKSVIWGGER